MFPKDDSKSTINFAENFEPQCCAEKLQANNRYASKLSFWQIAYKNQSQKLDSLHRKRNEQLILLSGQIMYLESQIVKRDEERSQLLYMKNKIIDEQQMKIEDLLFQVESMTTKKNKTTFLKQTKTRNNQKVLNVSEDKSATSKISISTSNPESDRKNNKYIHEISTMFRRMKIAILNKYVKIFPKKFENDISIIQHERKLNNITTV